jgi:hypothetical membrane protein
MKLIGIWALVAATLGPLQNFLGWTIAGSMVDGYDPISKTISDLAADDSPVKWIQSSFFLLGGTLTLIGAWSAKSISLPGRLALAAAGIATYGFTIFSTPSQTSSSPTHVLFATISFVLFSAWPLLGLRFNRDYHWSLRPKGAIPATIIMGVATLWFLITWLEPGQPLVGVSERLVAFMQVVWLSMVIWLQFLHQRKLALSTT